MNFELNSDQISFINTARNFAEKELYGNSSKWDQEEIFPKEAILSAGGIGFCGLYCPEKKGGMGLSRLDSSLIFEQLAMGCTSTTAFITIHNMATWMICTFGTDALNEKLSHDLTSGKKLVSYCLTEPNSGSDAASIRTVAKKSGDKYILNGSKIFTSGAGSTDILLVMARTGDKSSGGISAFVLDAKSEGISFGKKEKKMGWNNQPTRSITFEDVEIPTNAVLGSEGGGFKIAMKGLDGGRINIATCSVGTAQAAIDAAKKYMTERKQFGNQLSNFQALQFKISDMTTNIVASRLMVRLAASKLDNKDPDLTYYCAMAKQFATDTCFDICDEALQIFGGIGYIKDYPLERYLRDTRVHRILEGTNEIMRVIISRRILTNIESSLL